MKSIKYGIMLLAAFASYNRVRYQVCEMTMDTRFAFYYAQILLSTEPITISRQS